MKDENHQDNTKRIITEHFINALDYLIDSGKVDSVAEFERLTGFRAQRITGMRAYVHGDSNVKPQYVGISHLKVLKDEYNVSMDYIFNGTKPIIKTETKVQEPTANTYQMDSNELIREELRILREKMNILDQKLELYKSMMSNQKPSGTH